MQYGIFGEETYIYISIETLYDHLFYCMIMTKRKNKLKCVTRYDLYLMNKTNVFKAIPTPE